MKFKKRPLLLSAIFLSIGVLIGFLSGFNFKKFTQIQSKRLLAAESSANYKPSTNSHRDSRILFWKLFPEKGSTVVLGDSHVELVNWNAIFPCARIINRGITGDTIGDLIQRLDSIKIVGAKTAVLLVGTNDLLRGVDPETVQQNYNNLIDLVVSTGVNVVSLSIPVTNSPGFSRSVLSINNYIKNHCNTAKCTFVDINTTLMKDGVLAEGNTSDGIHLTATAYSKIANLLKPFIN